MKFEGHCQPQWRQTGPDLQPHLSLQKQPDDTPHLTFSRKATCGNKGFLQNNIQLKKICFFKSPFL